MTLHACALTGERRARTLGQRYGRPALWRVVFDPWDSFGHDSHYHRWQIEEMALRHYLADGTLFEHRDGRRLVVRDGGLVKVQRSEGGVEKVIL